ncbi:MAG: hypothetical protein DDT42_01925 [candidate division WS2 bacterium]|uniref:Uncharacterized protein n=1 Tax=Psychracetigena formicireducens TaxID=2986056 RepID=A0A9E2BJ86_PSYF1|nr:hypothetical protein [Candidatus Psychracetigena formicireducens]
MELTQLITQLPIVGLFFWYTIFMVDKLEKLVSKMQEDWQMFIKDIQIENKNRDVGYQAALKEFSDVLKEHTKVLMDSEIRKAIDRREGR